MKAIVIGHYGGVEQLTLKELPMPKLEEGDILIRIKAFGINRAETYMRQGLWGDVAEVSGIECVGEIEQDPSGRYIKGQKVAAIMGGMGRTKNGSYAEFTAISSNNIFPIDTLLSWEDFAAIPESYATAWSCLYENMQIKEGAVIFVRGGTSALGQAAINIASNINNVTVLASTRSQEHCALLKELGCAQVFIENENLSADVVQQYPQGIDSVMDIVGNTTLLDSIKMVKKSGYVCNAGFLGGGAAILFNPLTDLMPSVNLNLFASFMLGSENFPLSNIPMQTIVRNAESGLYKVKPAKILSFDEVPEAHKLMESNLAYGKIVVQL
ncbi:hypothetical protein A9Q74_05655 [Colwellia sp. 39_35_sub15_T18]|nr:hypothetical protein A9Q74_05655 [Colwellia sp. 39_35_sub15_T18]